MKSEFEIAITQLSSDRNLAPEIILEAIESALVSAYKRNYSSNQAVLVTIHPRTGEARVFVKKTVVDSVEDEDDQILLEDALQIDPEAQVGELVDIEVKPRNFGRIAAQTAKQVITQRIREAERDSVYAEYADRVGELINGTVRNVDARSHNVVISMGKAEALLPRSEQIPGEHYRFGQRLRVYLVDTERTGHGPQITVSRTHRDLLRRLLELEVPEIYNGTVEIKSIAREPGSRSKVAVSASQPGVDPVGSCVGMRGVRIQNIVNELNGEKIDVVAWAPDVRTFIANSLSPAKVFSVDLNEIDKTARVVVPDRSLSLAIGKEGQNARLAAKLTGWRIDIKNETEAAAEAEQFAAEREEAVRRAEELEEARRAAAELLAAAEVGLEDDESAEDALSEEAIEEALTANRAEFEPAQEEAVDAEPPADAVETSESQAVEAGEAVAAEVEETVAEETVAGEAVAAEVEEAVAAEVEEPALADDIEELPAGDAGDQEAEAVAAELPEDEDQEPALSETAPVVAEDESLPEQETDSAEVEEADVAMGRFSDDDVELDAAEEMDELEELDEVEEVADESDDDDDGDSRRDRRKSRGRQLEFDERQGRVVARKRRKANRQQQNWETEDWEEDF